MTEMGWWPRPTILWGILCGQKGLYLSSPLFHDQLLAGNAIPAPGHGRQPVGADLLPAVQVVAKDAGS